jgi:hypothetical protein
MSKEAFRRVQQDLRQELEGSLDERVARYLEIDHQLIVGNHHFAAASAECINLYRDGAFISTVMVSQAINEAILRFIAERNKNIHLPADPNIPRLKGLIKDCVRKGILSAGCAAASTAILDSSRNDVHHMNPNVAKIDFRELAKKNIQQLGLIEKELFAHEFREGRIVLKQPKYWDLQPDGTVSTNLRLE